MTGPTPAPVPKNEAEYASKLALAILSTLEAKGLLSKLDVDTILHVAHRAASSVPERATDKATENVQADTSAQAEGGAASDTKTGEADTRAGTQETPAAGSWAALATAAQPSVLSAPIEVKRPLGPAVLGTRWVKPDAPASPVARDGALDLPHDAGTVRIVGPSGAQDRPLSPPILSGGKAASEAVPAKGMDTPATAGPQTEPRVVAADEKTGEDPGAAPAERGRDLPPVIDFELD